jgi:hypothetical protein
MHMEDGDRHRTEYTFRHCVHTWCLHGVMQWRSIKLGGYVSTAHLVWVLQQGHQAAHQQACDQRSK